MNRPADKRNLVLITREEGETLKALLFKALIPIGLIIVFSSLVLLFGLGFLMKRVGFDNYGLAPAAATRGVSQFVATYIAIALTNIVLMIALSVIVISITLRNIVLPIMRITRELRKHLENKAPRRITVRKTDRLLVPLVDVINRMQGL